VREVREVREVQPSAARTGNEGDVADEGHRRSGVKTRGDRDCSWDTQRRAAANGGRGLRLLRLGEKESGKELFYSSRLK